RDRRRGGDRGVTTRAAEQRWTAWQTVDTGRLLLITFAAVLVIVAFARTAASPHFPAPHVAIAFGLYISAGELLRLVLPGGGEAAPIAISAALSYAMVSTIASPLHHGPAAHPPHVGAISGATPWQGMLVA